MGFLGRASSFTKPDKLVASIEDAFGNEAFLPDCYSAGGLPVIVSTMVCLLKHITSGLVREQVDPVHGLHRRQDVFV